MAFIKATKQQAKLRLALIGPSGSGKTFSALAIATGLGKRVAVIDTERGSAKLYSDHFEFDVDDELPNFAPETYVQKIHEAEKAGYEVLVIDSLSHAWFGKDGALEQVDNYSKRQAARSGGYSGGSNFTAWREVTPKHNALVDAMLQSPCHIVVTIRAKTEYVQEKDERGKTVVRKVGLAPIQRDGLEYEFTMVGDINVEHELTVSKTRCAILDGKVIQKPGRDLADTLLGWLNSGAPAPAPRPAEAAPTPAPEQNTIAAPPSTLATDLEAKFHAARTAAQVDAAAAEVAALKPKLAPADLNRLRVAMADARGRIATLNGAGAH